jgi:hypothetical protein
MTYFVDAIQYIVVAVGAKDHPELVAYRLPDEELHKARVE